MIKSRVIKQQLIDGEIYEGIFFFIICCCHGGLNIVDIKIKFKLLDMVGAVDISEHDVLVVTLY